MKEQNTTYVKNQICVRKTNNSLIEFLDKLKPASAYNYAKIHAGTDELWNNKKLISCIGIRIGSYRGEDKHATYVDANISPGDVSDLLEYAKRGLVGDYDEKREKKYLEEEKIIAAAKGDNGRAPVKKLSILRQSVDKNGAPRKMPVYVAIENGTGIPVTNPNGGTSCQKNSYVKENVFFVFLTDKEFHDLIQQVADFVKVWETITGARLYREKEKIIEEKRAAENQPDFNDIPA